MWIGVISIFPEMFRAITASGVVARAVDRGVVDLHLFNPRDYTSDRHASVDDRPYGGGPGMLMQVAPLAACLAAARRRAAAAAAVRTVYLSPQGERLRQSRVRALADAARVDRQGLLFICGRYEGIDERLLRHEVDEELSIGDYVLTGGELAAMVVIDAMARYVPGTLGNSASVDDESHVAGVLDCPHYTRPEEIFGERVPSVLLAGDHAAVGRWRRKMALGRTYERRPDLLAQRPLSADERTLLCEYLSEQDASATDIRSETDA